VIVGLDCFGDNSEAFETFNIVNSFKTLEITKMKVDEISVQEGMDVDITDESKKEWQFDQILLAEFKNNLEAGNIGLQGMPIQFIKIKKRKKEDLKWNELRHLPFDKNTKNYYYLDYYVSALEEYEYAVQPIGYGDVAGNNIYSEITSDFDGTWLMDKDKQYKLMYNLDIGNYETTIPSTIIETLGGQYPYVFINGDVKYRKGSLKCMLLSDSTLDKCNIDRKQEKNLREGLMKFLTDKKPKIYKDGSGITMVVMLVGSPTLIPRNDLSQQVYEVSLEFIEIADMDSKSLIENGLLEL
jgi:hypothetical protein